MRAVDRRAGRRRVEHGQEPVVRERRSRALEEPRREAAAPVGPVHEHHADPAERGRVGERERGRDQAATVPYGEARGRAGA